MSETENKTPVQEVAEVAPVVEEPVAADPAVAEPATEVVEEAVPAEDAGEPAEKKRKSFFDIFKKKESEDEAGETGDAAAAETEAADAPAGDAAPAAEEVPAEKKCAKKLFMCAWCCPKKKECTEEAKPEDGETAAATDADAEPAAETAAEPVAEPVTEPVAEAVDEPATEAVAAAVVTDTDGEAVEAEAEVPVDVVRSGVLWKSGKWWKRGFNERHCRLLHSGAFQWSKTADFAGAHECCMASATSVTAFMAEGEDTAHKFRLEIVCSCGTLTFATDSEEDRDEWLRAFETVKPACEEAAAGEGEGEVEALPVEASE